MADSLYSVGMPQLGLVKRLRDMGDGSWADVVALGAPVAGGVTMKVNAGSVAPGQTLKTYTGTIALSTSAAVTQALETVTAGKTFYVTDIVISANTAQQFLVQLQAAGVDIFDDYCKGDTAPIQATGIESQPNAAAGTAVQLRFAQVAAATIASYFVAGFEQ